MSGVVAVSPLLAVAVPAPAVELVKDGKPLGRIVADVPPAAKPAAMGARKRAAEAAGGEGQAFRLLVEWVKKITDAELPVADKAGDGPAI